ncbi:MAG: HAMP domain-containing histidine kinase [Burkholderiaceae bacterium]|nr:HAMP domain-containing histidine kinase [Burkholderiaceae bacterium]
MLAGALVAWPVSRRITSRLVRLQAGVDRQAAGDLRVRVPVEGRDEVAVLARSFNQSAERIEALVNRQEELLASQKRLLANASHELRSPLARIRMALELLLADPNEAGHFADELRRNIAELDQLVDEILLASRLETTPMARESVDLAGLAAEEASRVDAVAASDDGDTPLVVTGDPRLLRRLLRNLLENASRHGDGAGEPVRIELAREAESVRIAVLDRGPGVPPESRERIFEPFYRVGGHSEQSGGVGLGLALVRQIASAHGGDARCEAREGGGSRFVVSLPVAGPRPGPPPDSPAARCGPS